jgi:molybdopterin-guanine dinucleotide biosynthesis protein A
MIKNRIDDVSIVILCGGQSTRMGTDKVAVQYQGRPLIEHILDTAKSVFSNILISSRTRAIYDQYGYPVIIDEFDVPTPLAGIHAGLKAITTQRALFVAVDMPLVKPEMLRLLAATEKDADVVVPKVQGYLEPLIATYSTRCLAPIEKAYHAGERKIVSFYPDVNVKVIDQATLEKTDAKLRSFINVNSKAGLRAIEALADLT